MIIFVEGIHMEREWVISITIKIGLLLVLPLGIIIESLGHGSYISILFQFGEPFMGIYGENINPFLVLPFVLVFMIPGIIFDFVQYHKPKESSVNRYLVGAYIASNQIILYLCVTPLILLISVGSWELIMIIQYGLVLGIMAASWSQFLLIVLPFFTREIRVLTESQNEDALGKTRFQRIFSRYNLIAFILAATIYITPIVIAMNPYGSPMGGNNIYFVSGIALLEFMSYPYSRFTFYAMAGLYYPMSAISCGFYIYYASKVLAYLKGKESLERCLAIGLVSVISSPFITSVMPLVYSALGAIMFPIPIIFIVGTIVTLVIKPTKVVEGIWDEDLEQKVFKAPEKDSDTEEEVKRVQLDEPAVHSKSEKKDKPKERYDWDHKDEDVFGNE